ncbi:hypothetical protein BT96DRAFT_994469 [Gymnopus androsaceus JB14]|uniref:Prolyl 4-hydroxylase alpha subunit Fe(2+) 2OG dioxygenase domain-containing protein n=1 Tax=Gymnopus androsaceus JB14 TaxID=1447944 RepID=A0A6A4HPF2_9AGAR|nr:hypothetical protein BT96DRAFT_994469 [Gymnopus androsaceus JB14]
MSETTHPLLDFLKWEGSIGRYERSKNRFQIAKDSKISNALTGLAFLSKPQVDNILEVAKENQSKFGRGEETVLDLEYRNGFEIEAKDMDTSGFKGNKWGPKMEDKIKELAVYQKDGHFDWHRDTTHGDNHHGTVLVSLNTSWKGGELCLRHRGVVAFYTDVEHKVKPVTKGARIVLQYDVYLPENAVKDADGDESDPDADEDQYDDDGDDDDSEYDEYGDRVDSFSKVNTARLQKYKFELPNMATENEDALDRLIQALESVLSNPRTKEVGFPLRHLYRQQSILPQYLKGVDALVYQRLSEESSPLVSLSAL